jgi:hypothetical protein
MKKFNVSLKQRAEIGELLSELRHQLRKGEMLADPKEVYSALQRFSHPDIFDEKKKNAILRLMSADETLIIDSCDGTKTFADEDGIFNHINKNIHQEDNHKEEATAELSVRVHDIEKNVPIAEAFYSLSDEKKKLCLTEHQIVFFCTKYYSWLRIGSHSLPTLFLRKKGKFFFIVRVFGTASGDLSIREDRLKHGGKIWPSGVRIVTPDLSA